MATSFFSHAKERSATSRLDALTRTAVISPSRKKWNFNPRAKVRANGEIPTLKVELSHRIGANSKVKAEVKNTLTELQKKKEKKQIISALRKMVTQTGRKCYFTENNKLKIGNRYAKKEEMEMFNTFKTPGVMPSVKV